MERITYMDLLNVAIKKRKECKVSQMDIADKLGVTNKTVSIWEKGDNSIPFDKFVSYCDIVGLRVYID